MKYFIKVFGCQMNQSDAERITSLLEKYKFKSASSIDEADFVVFVTCGVRQSAEDRVYGQINNLRKIFPEKIVFLTGCLAHRKDVQRRLKSKVDLFTTIKDFPRRLIESGIMNQELRRKNKNHYSPPKADQPLTEKFIIYDSIKSPCNEYLEIIPKYTSQYQAFVPIMSGCNNFCAYCVVPYARGREYSRPAEDILKEVKSIVKKGYKEIILLGQNVNSYCDSNKNSSSAALADEDLAINFPKLLKLIEKIPGRFWLTFLTSHPKDMSDDLIETIAKSKKICEYISLPAQSGDNEILRQMNRKYSVEHYKSLIKKIRTAYKKFNHEAIPAISTDIIVGFPGETKKQFENSAKLLREAKFDMAYIAQYSPRPETAAWRMKDNVSKTEKERRDKVLTAILKKSALENNKKYIGKVVEVLVDMENTYRAHTRTQKNVVFSSNLAYRQAGKKIPVGSFAKVKITSAKAFGLEGEII